MFGLVKVFIRRLAESVLFGTEIGISPIFYCSIDATKNIPTRVICKNPCQTTIITCTDHVVSNNNQHRLFRETSFSMRNKLSCWHTEMLKLLLLTTWKEVSKRFAIVKINPHCNWSTYDHLLRISHLSTAATIYAKPKRAVSAVGKCKVKWKLLQRYHGNFQLPKVKQSFAFHKIQQFFSLKTKNKSKMRLSSQEKSWFAPYKRGIAWHVSQKIRYVVSYFLSVYKLVHIINTIWFWKICYIVLAHFDMQLVCPRKFFSTRLCKTWKCA